MGGANKMNGFYFFFFYYLLSNLIVVHPILLLKFIVTYILFDTKARSLITLSRKA